MNGPSGSPFSICRSGIVVMLDDYRVDLRIDLGGPRDRLVQQFAGTDLLLADQLGKADGVVSAVFPERHINPRVVKRRAI